MWFWELIDWESRMLIGVREWREKGREERNGKWEEKVERKGDEKKEWNPGMKKYCKKV